MSRTTRYTDAELIERSVSRQRLPRHIAVIMDGNGRWAQQRMLPRIEGHRRGVKSVRCLVEECSRLGMQQLTLFCFSSENWKRPQRELTLLMHLLKQYVIEERREIMRQGLRFRVIGKVEELDPVIQQEISKTEDASAANQGMTLCLAVNYGARMEIARAVQSIGQQVRDGLLDPSQITEQTVADNLMTSGMPDPDLVIRTAGEMRISNFLLWQISYAELWVTPKFWPEFREPDLYDALKSFASRDRRFGGLANVQGAIPESATELTAKHPTAHSADDESAANTESATL